MSDLVEWLILIVLLQILWAIPVSKRKSDPISLDIDWGKWLPLVAIPLIIVIGVFTLQNLDRIIATTPGIKIANQNTGGALLGALPYVFGLALGMGTIMLVIQHIRGRMS